MTGTGQCRDDLGCRSLGTGPVGEENGGAVPGEEACGRGTDRTGTADDEGKFALERPWVAHG
jgi:hypothetical protein